MSNIVVGSLDSPRSIHPLIFFYECVCVCVCSCERVTKHVFWNFQVEVCLSHLRKGKTSADGQPLGSIAHCHHWITVQGEMRCLITSIPWFHLLNP